MRVALTLLALLLLATTASARPSPVGYAADVTTPSEDCPDCVGLTAGAWTLPPPGCYDCDTVGAVVGVEDDADGTTVSAAVCKGGFVHICIIDERITV